MTIGMKIAAMLACAAVCGDVKKIIQAGLSEIPVTSRLYAEANRTIGFFENHESAEFCMRWVHRHYDETMPHDWCHTIPNALIVITALLYGRLDLGRSIGMAVQAGFDTDCNGATVGSVVGMAVGASGIPGQWTEPFHNRVDTTIFGVGTISVDELVRLTMEHIGVPQ